MFKKLWQLLNRGVVLLPLLWTLVAIGCLMDGEPQNAVLFFIFAELTSWHQTWERGIEQ